MALVWAGTCRWLTTSEFWRNCHINWSLADRDLQSFETSLDRSLLDSNRLIINTPVLNTMVHRSWHLVDVTVEIVLLYTHRLVVKPFSASSVLSSQEFSAAAVRLKANDAVVYAAEAWSTIQHRLEWYCVLAYPLQQSSSPVSDTNRSWLAHGSAFRLKRSYSTPGPVSTAMGDCLRAGKPSRCEACQLGRLSLLPSVGR